MAYANWEEVALRVNEIVKQFRKSAKFFDEFGMKTLDPKNARKFYLINDNSMISLDDEDGRQIVRFYLSGSQDYNEVDAFIQTLRNGVENLHHNLEIDTKKYDKEITPKDMAADVARTDEKRNIRTFRDIVNEMLFKSH